MQDQTGNQFVGFMMSMLITAALLAAFVLQGDGLRFANTLDQLSPGMGAHAQIIEWSGIALIVIAGITSPFVSMMRDGEQLESVGWATCTVIKSRYTPYVLFAIGAMWYFMT